MSQSPQSLNTGSVILTVGGPGNREQKEDMVPALKELTPPIRCQRSRMCPWKWFATLEGKFEAAKEAKWLAG